MEKLVPKEYHEYLDIFSEEENHFSESQSWAREIEMKEGSEPK